MRMVHQEFEYGYSQDMNCIHEMIGLVGEEDSRVGQ